MKSRNEFKNEVKAPAGSANASKSQKVLQEVLGGGFLAKSWIVNLLPFLFYATFLTILYIANIYYAEKDIREFNALKKELKELRYEYISNKSKLMSLGKQSEVSKRLAGSGVKESVVPPYKLFKVEEK